MKLCEQIQQALSAQYESVLIADERGDGHFVQVVCVDESFANQNPIARTRALYKAVEPWQDKVHAWSMKGFTGEEWEQKKDQFEFQQYRHYPKP